MITRALLALLLITLMCSPVILAEDIAAEVVTTTSDRCTLEQKTDLVLLGLSLDEVNEKCGASGDKESQTTVNNDTSTPGADYSQPVFVHRHGPENLTSTLLHLNTLISFIINLNLHTTAFAFMRLCCCFYLFFTTAVELFVFAQILPRSSSFTQRCRAHQLGARSGINRLLLTRSL